MNLHEKTASWAGVLLAFALLLVAAPATMHADSLDSAPDQASCDSGSTSFTWSGLGIARPVIASMTVDGETIADPTHPTDGSIGAIVCPNVELARKTGLTVYRRSGTDNHIDLTGALTPAGHPITASSNITLTLTNMGQLAQYYSYSLVHGVVSTWTTANLGTSTASLTVVLSPVRTPLGSGDSFAFCTATPPNCNAPKSDADVLSASLDMDFDQTTGAGTFTGAYFGLIGSMGGFVQAVHGTDGVSSLSATLGAPHTLADGTTANVGSMQAFLPNSVLSSLLGISGTVDTSTLAVSRTEGTSTTTVPFTITAVTGGVILHVADITFSSPVYTIKKAAAVSSAPLTLTSFGTIAYDSKISQYYYTGHRPTFSGTATAASTVTVTIHSDPITCTATANSSGKWSCTPSQDIPDGDHTVLLSVVAPGGATNSITFKLGINNGLAATGDNTLPISLAGVFGALVISYMLYRSTRRG